MLFEHVTLQGGEALIETVPFSMSLFLPTFWAEARASEKEDGLKEKDYLTYFSAALNNDEVVICALHGFNLQHWKGSNCESKAHKFMSTCNNLHNVL